jgi:hypothetical protein
MDLVVRRIPGRIPCTLRVHTRLHRSTLRTETVSPSLLQLFIALDSFQRGERQHSLTSETYPPSVTRGQHRAFARFLTDSPTPQAREWMAAPAKLRTRWGAVLGVGSHLQQHETRLTSDNAISLRQRTCTTSSTPDNQRELPFNPKVPGSRPGWPINRTRSASDELRLHLVESCSVLRRRR